MTFTLSEAPHHLPHYPLFDAGDEPGRVAGESTSGGHDR